MAVEGPAIDRLAAKLGAQWGNIADARRLAAETAERLRAALARFDSSDVSIVVFGSLAREEFTPGSDADWTLLVDGQVSPDLVDLAAQVGDAVRQIVRKDPGREGTFGSWAFSHELVHLIGGEDDSNRNTTRRILLLLESAPLGRRDAYDRVVRSILERYLGEDGFPPADGRPFVPRFMLNDFARYWRTMAVDFAHKRRQRAARGAALRRVKLRISRKLIYASGLLTCFRCRLGRCREECGHAVGECVEALREHLQRPPLENLADVLLAEIERPSAGPDFAAAAGLVFSAYDSFLGLLDDSSKRDHLENLQPDQYEADDVYQQGRAMSHDFRDGLMKLFFATGIGSEDSTLAELTKAYGVF